MAGENYNPEGGNNAATDWNAFVRQVAQEVQAQTQQPPSGATPPALATGTPPALGTPVQPPASPSPLELTLDGQVFKFNTPAEMSVAVQNTLNAMRQKAAEQQLQAAGQPAQPGAYVQPDAPPPFSQERYVELLKSNPIDAQEYVDNYRYFGGKVERPSEVIRERLERAEVLEKTVAVFQFKQAHPEWPGGEQLTAALEQVRQEFNHPFSPQGLEASWAVMQQRYPQLRGPQQQQAQPQFAPPQQQAPPQATYFPQMNVPPQTPYGTPLPTNPAWMASPSQASTPPGWQGYGGPVPPPVAPRGGAELPPDILSMAEQMQPDQLQQFIEKLAAGGAVR